MNHMTRLTGAMLRARTAKIRALFTLPVMGEVWRPPRRDVETCARALPACTCATADAKTFPLRGPRAWSITCFGGRFDDRGTVRRGELAKVAKSVSHVVHP